MSVASVGYGLSAESSARGGVTVSFFATVRDVFGEEELTVPIEHARCVRDLLDGLCTTSQRESAVRDGDGSLRRDLTLLVNGHHVGWLQGLDSPLKSGDVVSIFPQLFGG